MMTYWTRFAANGNPNDQTLAQWPVYSSKTDAYLELGNEIKAGKALRKDRLTLCESMRINKKVKSIFLSSGIRRRLTMPRLIFSMILV